MATVGLIYVHSLLWYQLDNDTMLFVSFLEQQELRRVGFCAVY
jgi:hypothetical protein